MSLIPIGVTTGESNKFYETLFKNSGKIAEKLEERNNRVSKASHPPLEGLNPEHCLECGREYTNSLKGQACTNCGFVYPGPTFSKHRAMLPTERAAMEIYYRNRETNIC